jgi:hypothetical protein
MMNQSSISVGGNFENSGILNLGEISGNVTNTINNIPTQDARGSETSGIKRNLGELKAAIESETDLPDEIKVNALQQVDSLAKSVQIKDESKRKLQASMAFSALKTLNDSLANVAKLSGSMKVLLPLIGGFFALV